jgi:hypothetical protein
MSIHNQELSKIIMRSLGCRTKFTLTVTGGMKKQKEVVNNTSSCRRSWLTVKGVESWGKKRQSGKATKMILMKVR